MIKRPELLAPAGLSVKAAENKIVCPELLAPAGSLEKMKIALEFGADAVYFGLPDFSLRARINMFDEKTIKKAAEFCRKKKKKFYMTLNIYAHQRHLKALPKHLKLIEKIKPDGVIVSDPGILSIIRKELPAQEIHLSTQANATNSEAVKFWSKQGIKRVIMARETTFREIEEIKKTVPEVELECFVHGAMCMSYSGRCILSQWMAGRSANLGDCAQPCRWKYGQVQSGEMNSGDFSMAVIDDKKKHEIALEEDRHGTYFFNSKDLNMIEHVGKFIEAGVDTLKIEGRAKSVYYVAVVTRAYRQLIDAACEYKAGTLAEKQYQQKKKEQKKELNKLSGRGYSAGFYFGNEPEQLFDQSSLKGEWQFVGISQDSKNSAIRMMQVHNVLERADKVEAITSRGNISTKIISICCEGKDLDSAHGGQGKEFQVELADKIDGIFLLRKELKQAR